MKSAGRDGVTEPGAGDAAARRRHDALQALVDANDQPVFALDRDLCYTAFNRAHATVMRALYGVEIALGGRLPDYQTVAADRDVAVGHLERALAGEHVTARAFSGEGERRRDFEVVHTPQLDAAGGVVGVVVRAYDVTDRQRAHAALRERDARLDFLVDQTPTVHWTLDQDLRFTASRGGGLKALGLEPDEVVGQYVDDYLKGAGEPGDLGVIMHRRALAGESFVYEQPLGDLVFDIILGPLRDASQAIVGVIGVAYDATERKRAEAALRESEERFRLLSSNTPDSTSVQDADLRYEWVVNPALGMTPEDVVGKTDADLVDAEQFEMVRALKQQVMDGGEPLHLEVPLTDAAGAVSVYDGTYVPRRDADGRVTGILSYFKDITERKMAEAALEERERALAALTGELETALQEWRRTFDAMRDAVALFDAEGRIVRANAATVTFTGLDFAAIAGRPCYEVFHGTSGYHEKCPQLRAVESGRPESSLFEQDGRWLRVTFDPELDADGRVSGGVHVVSDVSELVQLEQLLVESEAKFKYIFDNSPVGKSITLPGGEIQVNGAFGRMVGYSPAELEHIRWQDITLPEDVEATQREIDPLLAGERDQARFVKRYVHKSGAVVWADVATFLRRDADGQPVYFVTAVMDITERKRAQDALHESEEQLAGALEGSDIGLWDWHVQTGEVVFNKRWAEIVGCTLEEISPVSVGTWEAFVHPDDLKRSSELIARHFAGESPIYECEARMHHKDGHWVWVLDRGRVREWDDAGRPVRMIGTHLDITARKTAEAELARLAADLEDRVAARTEQLEAANQELEAFAYSVSHDLRAPLRAIDGFSAVVMEDAGDRLDETETGYLQRVRDAAQRMASLIDDLLALSHAARADIAREQVDVSALAWSIVEELREAEPARTVDVVVTPGIEADADPVLLRAILVNLLGNAWKFTGRHARARIEIGCTEDDGEERVYFVRDDGAGFDPAQARHLFGAFQRFHTPDQFEGNGIGLATVQRLVARHGGRVWVEAEVEKGATFSFTLTAKTDA